MTTNDLHDHDRGLSQDLPMIIERSLGRRGLFALFGGLGAAAVAGCGSEEGTPSNAATTSGGPGGPPGAPSSGAGVEVAAGEIPEETAGPFPGNGSNGPDALGQSGVVRRDIRGSFGGRSAVAEGVPLTVRLKVYDLNGDQATVLPGAAVYLWHCDRDGNYSMYSSAVQDENYLRGVQVSDAEGWVGFQSVFPGAYAGRWPHIHFEVYPGAREATAGSGKLRTTQLAFPQDVCEEVYTAAGYEQSVTNLARTSLESDMVFADGHSLQLAKLTGSNDDGWVATLNVPV